MTLKLDKDPIELDADQMKAVRHFEGPALVVAGPGSGKTTVIIKRILNLIQNHNVPPEQILAIAFTNAAVEEMNSRFPKGSKPKICTLHTFGKDLITNHHEHELLKFSKEPDIWDANDIKRIIYEEKNRLNRANSEKPVVIYKFEGTTTGRCYIGQTTDPCRRELEHRTYSSNRGLREALEKGDEQFEFKKIKIVKGEKADEEEAEQINLHRNRAAVNLNQETEQIEEENPYIPVTIYKIKSSNTVTCSFGLTTTDLESIDRPEGFEVIDEEVPLVKARRRIAHYIARYKNWAVLNRQDPLQKPESNKRRIEIFCQHFNVSYDEVLKNTPKFKDLMKKFDRLKDDIESAKRQVNTGLFEPNKIDDPIFRAFAKRYKKRKKEADAIDFLDMLIYSAYLLEKDPTLRQYYHDKHRYVFVDEFQDISPIDFRVIDLFSENLFTVGDDDQAIYGFRGGDSSIMREKFGKRRNVTQYKITRNYRSTSEIVKYAKTLIGHNSDRICKNLHADNSAKGRVRIVPISRETVKQTLLKELSDLLTTDFKEVGILARNWHREINEIQRILESSELDTQGFKIGWEELDDPKKDLYDPYAKNRRIMVIHRGGQKIEVLNIHTAKGREWDKVIFLVNTMSKSLPWDGNDLIDERRLFYVAATRARQELVVLDGGNCQFVSEFQIVETIESQIKKELQEISQKALETLKLKFKKELKKELTAILKQSDELNRLRGDITEAEKGSEQMNTDLPKQLKVGNKTLLKSLIPVLDEFESQIKGLQATDESNNRSDDFVAITKNVQLAQGQLLNLLKDHGLKPIETFSGATFNPVYHEELSPEIYSNGVLAGRIAREEQRGYLLHNQVIRKAYVVISKRKQRADALLCWDFAQPVRFVTYAGFRDLRDIETFKDGVKGLDSQGEERQLQNFNVLFAFPKDDMAALKSNIATKRTIADRNLQPIHSISDRYHVADDVLKSLRVKRDAIESDNQSSLVQLVTRSGHVLTGLLWDFDEDFLYMNMNKKVVIVYRAGILKLEKIWNKIAKVYKKGTTIKGHVTTQTKNGLRVEFGLLHGFLPKSQVELKFVRNLDSYVGKTLKMKITKLSKINNSIVLSRRVWLEKRKTKLLNTLEIDQRVTGVVKNITNFGAFIDLDGVDGLLHKSEMAWKPINHPSQVLSAGEEVEVKVIKVDRENEKISLSLKQMTTDPWRNVEDKYPIGSKVSGVVVNIVNYGAFIQLEEGIVGLIHVSEMPLVLNSVSPLDLLNENHELEVTILQIRKDLQQISLSIK